MVTLNRSDRRRRSQAEKCIVELLRSHPTGRLSYDAMAAESGFDRRSLISAMARLRYDGHVAIAEPGRGSRPHRYALTATL